MRYESVQRSWRPMTRHANHKTSVSSLVGASVIDAEGKSFGRVKELAFSPIEDAVHVRAMVVRKSGKASGGTPSCVLIAELRLNSDGVLQLRENAQPAPLATDETYVLLERDLLDQQIIDINGHKVVRVNDVELVWEPVESDVSNLRLRISEVEVGMRGAIRRILKGLPVSTVDRIAERFKPSVIPWNFVDLIDRDPARRVKLKIEQDRLSGMHPSDLADILEDLAPAERQALFTSLDEEVAAEALEEVEPRMQKSLTESLDSEHVAGIVEEMDPAAAADFLAEL